MQPFSQTLSLAQYLDDGFYRVSVYLSVRLRFHGGSSEVGFMTPLVSLICNSSYSWRWTYGIGCFYSAVVLCLIAFFGKETLYDRSAARPKSAPRSISRLRHQTETLLGITGARLAKYRSSWSDVTSIWFRLVWRPHLFPILLFEAMLFGFSVGLNGTNLVFLQEAPPAGYGFTQFAIAGCYATPLVSVIIGEVLGHFLNDWVMNVSIRRNSGVFEAESRLWSCYVAVAFYVVGFVLIGSAFQHHLNIGVFIIGWGLAEVATMVNTVAVWGFTVAYFQVPWATKHGAIQTFGVEAAVVAGLFLLAVPTLQLTGNKLRERFSL
ncbi:hypothetical protein NM688_g8367 [Phlebia brevispora]|uniref:Uncharacterized protein n=1 Tax=Phlebia brevispora TaxID=194682 RepID=A0ACC1RTH3_9APHY|nr:hypothetical protein NM688_g8367 [Phlebia brevispora]